MIITKIKKEIKSLVHNTSSFENPEIKDIFIFLWQKLTLSKVPLLNITGTSLDLSNYSSEMGDHVACHQQASC